MRCQCGRSRVVALDKHFRTVLLCETCEVDERAEPATPRDKAPAALQDA